MKTLFIGSYHNPGGPNEVNRNLLKYLPSAKYTRIKNPKGLMRRVEGLYKILFSRSIIFSGIMFFQYEVKFAKLLNKKIIYLMHGCAMLETERTNFKEILILDTAQKILCVSNTYAELIRKIFPKYRNKVDVLLNGIDWDRLNILMTEYNNLSKDNKRIILFGGGRKEKGNLAVCRAVDIINQETELNLHIDVYGYFRDSDDSKDIADCTSVTFHHVIPHDQINIELAKSFLYIQNSKLESFGLGLIDAIGVGCNVLYSQFVGAKDIIGNQSEHDIIYNTDDINEIKHKIMYIIQTPNNARIHKSIDQKSTSIEAAAHNLMKIVENL